MERPTKACTSLFITKFYLSGLRLDNFLESSVLASSKLMDIDNKKKINSETDLAFIVWEVRIGRDKMDRKNNGCMYTCYSRTYFKNGIEKMKMVRKLARK